MTLTNRQIERYSRQLIVKDFGGIAQERLLAAHVLLLADHQFSYSVLAYLVGAGVGQIDLCSNLDLTSNAPIDAVSTGTNPAAAAETAALNSTTRGSIVAQMRALNPDSTVRTGIQVAPDKDLGEFDAALAEFDLALALVSDDATLARARAIFNPPNDIAADCEPNVALSGASDVGPAAPSCAPKKGSNSAIILARLDQPARIAVIPRRPPCPRCANAGDLLAPIAPIGRCADIAGFVASLAALEAIKLIAHFSAPPKPTLIEFSGYESASRLLDSAPGSLCTCNQPWKKQTDR